MKTVNPETTVFTLRELEGDLRRREASLMELLHASLDGPWTSDVWGLQGKIEGVRLAIDLAAGYRQRELTAEKGMVQ